MSTTGGLVEWPELRTYTLSGADVTSWLNGQCTNLVSAETTVPVKACLVKPTGQLLSMLDITLEPAQVRIVEEGPNCLQSRFDTYVVMEDVELVNTETSAWAFARLGDDHFLQREPASSEDLEGWLPVIPWGSIELASLLHGFPLFRDTNAKTLPHEMGAEFLNNRVSFKKGCYVGQEVLHRIESQGHVNQYWRVLQTSNEPLAGSEIWSGEKKVGSIIRSSKSSSGTYLSCAFLRNFESTSLTVGGQVATLPPS